MFPIRITPEAMSSELLEARMQLTRALQNLSRLGEVQVGCSPRTEVRREDKTVLYHYRPQADTLHPVPVLIIYALVNRPGIADLQEGRSLIQSLLQLGIDVYLLDWGYADEADRCLTLDDYVNGYIDRSVDHVRAAHGLERINLLGICQGGTLSLCYTALHQEKVQNYIATVTPVDFHTPDDLLSLWVRHVDVELLVDAMGNLSGDMLNLTFLLLRPYSLIGQKYLDLLKIADNRDKLMNFLRMEKWIFDSPDQAGNAFREFLQTFYQDNALVPGTARIGGEHTALPEAPRGTVLLANTDLPAGLRRLERGPGLAPRKKRTRPKPAIT